MKLKIAGICLIFAIILISGCIETGKIENEFVSIERVEVYYVTNLTGTLHMSGNAQKYLMFVPHSGRYQEVTGPAGLQAETDEYGNKLRR